MKNVLAITILSSVILEERETGKTMTDDEIEALFWTLCLQFDELKPHKMEVE